jgi:Ca-activated chloride channel family protein
MTHRALAAFALALCACAAGSAPGAQAGEPIRLETRLASPVMKGGEAATNYLRIGLQGCKPEPSQNRTPVNVAFVIDRSGSMSGSRIAQAREAAIMAINRLQSNDIASVVIFDQSVDVLVPAQHVTDPNQIADYVRLVNARGSTAIHAGVLVGAAEVAKNKDARRLNRVVLLSDGQANVGPSRPADFAVLGQALLSKGISVSTIGLGLRYNEDLMLQLARASDGNHAFARDPSDLIQIFNKEFSDVLGSCAQTVSVDVEFKAGVRPVRALSRDGVIEGQRAQFTLNQVYAATEHYILLEVAIDKTLAEPPATPDGQEFGLVKVAYTEPASGAKQALDAPIRGRFSRVEAEIAAARDVKVTEAVVEQTTRERTERAIALQDQGKIQEARQLLMQNATEINGLMASMPLSEHMVDLKNHYYALGAQTAPASPESLSAGRKTMRMLQAPAASGGVRY